MKIEPSIDNIPFPEFDTFTLSSFVSETFVINAPSSTVIPPFVFVISTLLDEPFALTFAFSVKIVPDSPLFVI